MHGIDGRWVRYEALVDLHRNALLNAKLFITPHLAPIIKPTRALTCALNALSTHHAISPPHTSTYTQNVTTHHSIFIPSTGLANEVVFPIYLHSLIPDQLRPAREIGVSYGEQQKSHQ